MQLSYSLAMLAGEANTRNNAAQTPPARDAYQLMVPYWPEVAKNQSNTKTDIEFARAFDSINKIVFSRSLDSVEDKNTRIVRTSLRDEMLKLKQEQGKNILLGGVSLPSQLMELGLVKEYRFSSLGQLLQEKEDGCWCQPAGEIAIKTC